MDTRTLEVERSTSTAHRLLNYDGACANIHGHNMEWEVEIEVSMEGTGKDNMPLDFKDVSDLIDETDHTILLNVDDPLLNMREELGEKQVIVFEGDPTCELLTKWMARRFVEEIEAVLHAEVTCYETEKYGMTAEFPTEDERQEVEPTADLDDFTEEE